jgi:hypothetical protein
MNIGPLEIIISKTSNWEYGKAVCGCYLISLGKLDITWYDRGCICANCKNKPCNCDGDLDDQSS